MEFGYLVFKFAGRRKVFSKRATSIKRIERGCRYFFQVFEFRVLYNRIDGE